MLPAGRSSRQSCRVRCAASPEGRAGQPRGPPVADPADRPGSPVAAPQPGPRQARWPVAGHRDDGRSQRRPRHWVQSERRWDRRRALAPRREQWRPSRPGQRAACLHPAGGRADAPAAAARCERGAAPGWWPVPAPLDRRPAGGRLPPRRLPTNARSCPAPAAVAGCAGKR